MAIIFEFCIECEDDSKSQDMVRHFAGLKHKLLTGRTISWDVGLEKPFGTYSVVIASSRDLSRYGVRTVQDAVETTEAGLRLYHHLLSAPAFRYAHSGWDGANIPMNELAEYVDVHATGQRYLSVDCVIDEALWEELGKPSGISIFKPGYRWHPYGGETYRPLGSGGQPELWSLRKELLPD